MVVLDGKLVKVWASIALFVSGALLAFAVIYLVRAHRVDSAEHGVVGSKLLEELTDLEGKYIEARVQSAYMEGFKEGMSYQAKNDYQDLLDHLKKRNVVAPPAPASKKKIDRRKRRK